LPRRDRTPRIGGDESGAVAGQAPTTPVGYGGTLNVPTVDIISTELSFVGNLVGTYNELADLTALAAQGRVSLHTATYSLEAVADAVEDLRAGRIRGRGILLA
jgi:NAD+-dependent secondary alcohol dehydrogenase Adh1